VGVCFPIWGAKMGKGGGGKELKLVGVPSHLGINWHSHHMMKKLDFNVNTSFTRHI
jgi:hypothetical protein